MLPLSFKDYVSAFPENKNTNELYRNYLINSSFPGTLELIRKQDIRTYLEGIYNTVLFKDIITRKKIADPAMLESIIVFMFDNIGNLCSSTKIAYTVMDENTLQRELSPLDSIKDHNPKYLLTMDYMPLTSYNGIKHINVLEWLLR